MKAKLQMRIVAEMEEACQKNSLKKRKQQEKEKKELKNLRALIYFTDGDGIYPRQKPDYETAFVFLQRTDKMKLVPAWAKCLITK